MTSAAIAPETSWLPAAENWQPLPQLPPALLVFCSEYVSLALRYVQPESVGRARGHFLCQFGATP